TIIKEGENAVSVAARCLLFNDGRIAGKCPLPETDIEQLKSRGRGARNYSDFRVNDWRVLLEPVRNVTTLYCFGAGHVAQPTARIAAMAGFRVVVMDDRAEWADTERFPEAHEVKVIEDYRSVFKEYEFGDEDYIVIVTRGHQYDHVVLEEALKTGAGYIGMIASRRKRDAVFQLLRARGVKGEELQRVCSPIGLDIGAETPEEIAVSVVAELIKKRSGQAK
ncbi:MAG: XdhC family protein, partial [Dehalococcoidales bacterium]|nr:XdhC family protein [Dehalococcoidales bacterium]